MSCPVNVMIPFCPLFFQACLRSTYQFLFDNCYELYQREFSDGKGGKKKPDETGPSLHNLDFWTQIISLGKKGDEIGPSLHNLNFWTQNISLGKKGDEIWPSLHNLIG